MRLQINPEMRKLEQDLYNDPTQKLALELLRLQQERGLQQSYDNRGAEFDPIASDAIKAQIPSGPKGARPEGIDGMSMVQDDPYGLRSMVDQYAPTPLDFSNMENPESFPLAYEKSRPSAPRTNPAEQEVFGHSQRPSIQTTGGNPYMDDGLMTPVDAYGPSTAPQEDYSYTPSARGNAPSMLQQSMGAQQVSMKNARTLFGQNPYLTYDDFPEAFEDEEMYRQYSLMQNRAGIIPELTMEPDYTEMRVGGNYLLPDAGGPDFSEMRVNGQTLFPNMGLEPDYGQLRVNGSPLLQDPPIGPDFSEMKVNGQALFPGMGAHVPPGSIRIKQKRR